MKISFVPWKNLIRPYKVDLSHLYTRELVFGQTYRWMLKPEVRIWLECLPPRKRFFNMVSAIEMEENKPFHLAFGDARNIIKPDSPNPVYFAHKDDILLLKLTWGSR